MRRPAPPTLLAAALLAAASACAPDEGIVGAVQGGEPGLLAAYYDSRGFQRPSGVYQDATIDFSGWELNDRIQARGHFARSVSIRWLGQIHLERDEPYTLSFELRGRVRIWIDGALIIDDWRDTWDTREVRAAAPVPGGRWSDLRVDWDQFAGPMTARLRSESASQPRAVVPETALRHPDMTVLPLSSLTAVAPSSGGLVAGGVSSSDDLFWDAWFVPSDGGTPRRLAPIGTTLESVDASGALWTAVAEGADERWLSPSDGSPALRLPNE